MAKIGGIIAGALAGGLAGVAQGMVEMSLAEAKSKYEKERDLRLAELTKERDKLLAGQTAERDTRLHERTVERDGQLHERTVERDAATREHQSTENALGRGHQSTENRLNREQQRELAEAQQLTSRQIAAMQDAGADRRSQAQIAATLDAKGVGDRFTLDDGRVMEKQRDGSWHYVVDPMGNQARGQRGFANGEDRVRLEGQIAAAKADVASLERRLREETNPSNKPKLQQELNDAKRVRDDLLNRQSRPTAQSSSAVGGPTQSPDDWMRRRLGG